MPVLSRIFGQGKGGIHLRQGRRMSQVPVGDGIAASPALAREGLGVG